MIVQAFCAIILVLWNNILAHSIAVTGFANVSSLILPYRSTFEAPSNGNTRIGDISAIAFIPGVNTTQVLLLADRSHMYSARLSIKDNTIQDVEFLDDSKIFTPDCPKCKLDTEGIAIVDNIAFVSTEPPSILQCPLNIEKTSIAGACLSTADRAANPFESFLSGASANKGFESLCVTVSGTQLVTGTERWLSRDEPGLVRLAAFDHRDGLVSSAGASYELIYRLSSSVIGPLELVELVALDQRGLDGGGQFLALERAWSAAVGNIIRLFSVSTRGATDVKTCAQLSTMDPKCGGNQTVLVKKELVFHWSREKPLAPNVLVDNYEGMALLPPRVLPGTWLVLVNDNNNNEAQVGVRVFVQ